MLNPLRWWEKDLHLEWLNFRLGPLIGLSSSSPAPNSGLLLENSFFFLSGKLFIEKLTKSKEKIKQNQKTINRLVTIKTQFKNERGKEHLLSF